MSRVELYSLAGREDAETVAVWEDGEWVEGEDAVEGVYPDGTPGTADAVREQATGPGLFASAEPGESPPDSATGKGPWVPYVGPEGGEGWQDADSGHVVYQDAPPGEAADASDLSESDIMDIAEAAGVSREDVVDLLGDGGKGTGRVEDPSSVAESLPDPKTFEQRSGHTEMLDEPVEVTIPPDEASEQLADELREHHGEAADRFLSTVDSWKGGSYSDTAATLEAAFKEALGLEGDVRNSDLEAGTVGDLTDVARDAAEISREYIRQHYGDEVEMYRGIGERAGRELMDSYWRDPGQDAFDIETNATDNFTFNPAVAGKFANRSDSARVSVDADVDENVVASTDLLHTGAEMYGEGGETVLAGWSDGVSPSDVEIDMPSRSGNSASLNLGKDWEDMNRHELKALSDRIPPITIMRDEPDEKLVNYIRLERERVETTREEMEDNDMTMASHVTDDLEAMEEMAEQRGLEI